MNCSTARTNLKLRCIWLVINGARENDSYNAAGCMEIYFRLVRKIFKIAWPFVWKALPYPHLALPLPRSSRAWSICQRFCKSGGQRSFHVCTIRFAWCYLWLWGSLNRLNVGNWALACPLATAGCRRLFYRVQIHRTRPYPATLGSTPGCFLGLHSTLCRGPSEISHKCLTF